MNKLSISVFSKIILFFIGGLFFLSLLFPMWRIELSAPQYPEGLVLQLYPNKIGGDVEIINGLNHYIGMKTLHTEDFFEFRTLPYIFIFFGLCSLSMIFFAKKRGLILFFTLLAIFVIVAATDFYRWNYNYGHNLDPNAAIKVPGMAYQPPILGYKKLLNFEVYSIPDTGGWLLISAGFLLFICVLNEIRLLRKLKKSKTTNVLFILVFFSLFSCSSKEVSPIKLNIDNCDFCKMTISNGQYGAEMITQKGRVYKFDDLMCMIHYMQENANTKAGSFYVSDYTKNNVLIPVEKAFFISGGNISSPMQGNICAFSNQSEAKEFSKKLNAKFTTWKTLLGK